MYPCKNAKLLLLCALVVWQVSEQDAVVDQDFMQPIRNSLDQRFEKRHCR